ncbi:MAG: hypothetical protein GY906_26025 [bacterium]|nr:hypothetical protein [bacterium]
MKTIKLHLNTLLIPVFAVLCLLSSPAIRAVEVDIYQSMESASSGDLLTSDSMNSSSYGGCGDVTATWEFRFEDLNHMWVSDQHTRQLPGQVIVDGVDYNSPGYRSWRFRNKEENHYVRVNFGTNPWGAPDHDRMTVAGYFTTLQTDTFSNTHDNIEVGGTQSFGVLQTVGHTGDDPPYIRAHSCTEGWVTTLSPTVIKVLPGKTYWVNLHYDGPEGLVKVAVFDPDDAWSQVGETAIAESVPESAVRSYAHFGRCSPHGDWPDNETSSYLDHIMIDFTNGAFPLLPDIALQTPTYWVSPTGQSSWEDAKSATPLNGTSCCSLETANANAVPGDTIYLRSGTYDSGAYIRPNNSGVSEEERIIYSSYNDEEVTISGASYGIYLHRKSFITVNGINFFSMRRFMRIYAGHYNTISHCDFDTRSPSSGDWVGALIADDYNDSTPASENSTHNWVHHCTFYRWVYGDYDEHRGALLDIGSSQHPGPVDESYYNLVEDSVFAYGGHHTLGVYSKYNVIRNNYFHNETNPDNWNYEGYRATLTEGPSAGHCLYEGNRFGWAGASGMALRSPNNIFRYNSFYHTGSGGIQVVANRPGVDYADHNHIYGNNFFHCGYLAEYSGFQGGIYFCDWGGQPPVGNVIKNSIFYDNNGGTILYNDGVAPQIVENNWEDNDIDPGFVDLSGDDPDDPTLPDLHLNPGSPAEDQGTWLTTITSAGASGTVFAVEDAGYFVDGWEIVRGDLIQLDGQSARVRIIDVNYATNTITVEGSVTWTQGLGVSLAYHGSAPDQGAHEITPSGSDTELPSTPQDLSATAVSESQIDTSWVGSTDNIGVTGYRVSRDGDEIATTTSLTYSDTGLTTGTTYTYTVTAYDAAGNQSTPSDPASATTEGPSALIFQDGFESGDTSAWSGITP